LWDKHEEAEEKIFPILENQQIKIMLFEHCDFRKHKNALISALKSGDNSEIKKALDNNVKIIIMKPRQHINDEDEVL